MKISLRTANGWTYNVENVSDSHCDQCKARLWIAPHGGIYCDSVHISQYRILDGSGQYVYSTKFLHKLLAYCRDTISIGEPKTLDEAIEALEHAKFYLITT